MPSAPAIPTIARLWAFVAIEDKPVASSAPGGPPPAIRSRCTTASASAISVVAAGEGDQFAFARGWAAAPWSMRSLFVAIRALAAARIVAVEAVVLLSFTMRAGASSFWPESPKSSWNPSGS